MFWHPIPQGLNPNPRLGFQASIPCGDGLRRIENPQATPQNYCCHPGGNPAIWSFTEPSNWEEPACPPDATLNFGSTPATNPEPEVRLTAALKLSHWGANHSAGCSGLPCPWSLNLTLGYIFSLLSPEASPPSPPYWGHLSHSPRLCFLPRRKPWHLELCKTLRVSEICILPLGDPHIWRPLDNKPGT